MGSKCTNMDLRPELRPGPRWESVQRFTRPLGGHKWKRSGEEKGQREGKGETAGKKWEENTPTNKFLV